jgi:hypothetical protein
MSKRVLLLFGVGVLLLVGALFLLKYELSIQPEEIPEEEPEAHPEPEPKPKKTRPAPPDLPINKTLSDEAGAETTN